MKINHYLSMAALLLAGASPFMAADASAATPSDMPFGTWSTFPEPDSDVKTLNNVKLLYAMPADGISIAVDWELQSEIKLLLEGKDTLAEFEFDEPSMVMDDMVMMIPLIFDSQYAAGEYQLQLPKGLFYQTKYNAETDAFEPFDGYELSAAESIYFNLDPENPGLFEDYSLTPAEGSVMSLDDVSLTFNSIPSYISVNMLAFDDITLAQGDTQYVGFPSRDQSSRYETYHLIFTDDSGEQVVPGPGEWTLTIPDSYFTCDGNRNGEIVAKYNLSPVALSPASGSTLSEITCFEVSFPGAKNVEFVGSEYMISLVSGQASGIPLFEVEKVADAEIPTFRLTPPEGFSEPLLGSMALNIDEGAFLIDGTPGETEGNSPRIQATYYYDRPVSQEYIPEPNAGEVVCRSWGYTVGFVFDPIVTPRLSSLDGVEVKFDDTVLRIGSENECYSGEADCSYSVMDNILSFFVVNADFHKEGTITVKISGDAYTLSRTPGFDVEHSWKVVLPKEYDFSLSPAGGANEADAEVVDSLNEILLVFENAEKAEVFMESGVSLKKSDYSLFMTAEIVPVEDAGIPTYRLVFTAPDGKEMTDGIYNLEIRYDTFTLDGVQTWPSYVNVERVYKLDVLSGVGSVEGVESATVTVVATDGRVVLKDANRESLDAVPAGIYVVNGKKIIIK